MYSSHSEFHTAWFFSTVFCITKSFFQAAYPRRDLLAIAWSFLPFRIPLFVRFVAFLSRHSLVEDGRATNKQEGCLVPVMPRNCYLLVEKQTLVVLGFRSCFWWLDTLVRSSHFACSFPSLYLVRFPQQRISYCSTSLVEKKKHSMDWIHSLLRSLLHQNPRASHFQKCMQFFCMFSQAQNPSCACAQFMCQ